MDIDPAEIGKNVSTTVPLVGDLYLVLDRLLEEKPHSECCGWRSGLQELAKAEKDKVASPRTKTIGPKRLLRELGNQMNDDAFVIGDVGQNQIWTAKYLPVKSGRFMTSGGLGTMGYSLPAAIGVKKALPDKQTIAVCGDGSAQMMFNELSTIVSNGLDLKIVLLNNRTLGLVHELQGIEGYKNFGVALPDTPDFQKLAGAYGLQSKKISADEDMAAAISEMFAADGPYLLECIVSPEEGTKTIYEVI
jgi:acetolactate synthase-1/2/3 large subunit